MEHITPNHYIALGFKYESWMAVAAKIANFEQSTDLLGIRDRLLALREERGEPCPVYINLDKGDTVEEQINRYRLADVTDEVIPYGSIMAGYREMPWLKNKDD